MNPDNSIQCLHLLDALCQSSLDDMWAVDRAYNLFYFNNTFKESARLVFGIELSVGMNLPDAFSKKNYPQVAIQYIALYERAFTGETFILNDSFNIGSRNVYREIHFFPVTDHTRAIIGVSVLSKDITDRVNAEKALYRVSQRLVSAFESSESGLFTYEAITDEAGNCIDFVLVDINRMGLQMLTIPKEELLDKKMTIVTPGVLKSGLFEKYIQVYRTGEVLDMEIQPHLDRLKPNWIHITCVKYEEGIFIAIRDITQKRQTEIALQESELKFKLISLASNDSLYDWDIVENSIAWSEGFAKVYGYQNESLQYTIEMWEISIYPEDRERVMKKMNQVLDDEKTNEWQDEYRIINNEGKILYVLDKSMIVRNEQGKAIRMLGGMQNITQIRQQQKEIEKALEVQKRLNEELAAREEELRKRENLLSLTGAITKVGGWEHNLENKEYYHTDEMYRIREIDPSVPLTLEQSLNYYPADDRERYRKVLEDLKTTGKEYDYELPIITAKGNPIWVRSIGKAAYKDGKIIRAYGAIQDITQQKKQQIEILEALQREQRLNEELAAREEELTTSEEELRQLNEQLSKNYRILEEKEFILRKAQNLAKLGSWEYNLLENTVLWSDEMYNIYDVTKDFVPTAEKIGQFFDQETYLSLNNSIQQLSLARKDIDFTVTIRTSSHQIKWINVQAYPTFENDRLIKLTGITHDITDFRKAEEKLRSSEEKFFKAFEMSPDLLIIIRQEDNIVVETNRSAKEVTGYSKEELTGKSIEDFNFWVNESEKSSQRYLYQQTGSAQLEVTLRKKDGSYFEAFISTRKIEIEGVEHRLNVVRDITEKKLSENKIKQSENNLNVIINNTDMSIWSIDRNYRITALNRAFKNIMLENYNVTLDTGANALDNHLPGSYLSYWKPIYDRALAGESIWLEESWGDNHYEHSLNPIMAEEEVKGVAIYVKDTTDRIQKEERIRQNALELADANKKMSELKMMALRSVMNPHFIFNALNSIQYFVSTNDRHNAINYLSCFSKLIRGVLHHSVKNRIRLSEEIELLKYYIELELIRFENKFTVVYHINPRLDLESIEIPSLLIQPFVENAIIHGLNNKKNGTGLLNISISKKEGKLLFIIEDNGIGRTAAAKLKDKSLTQHQSMGITITQERLALINQGKDISVEIEDLFKEEQSLGTRVKIYAQL